MLIRRAEIYNYGETKYLGIFTLQYTNEQVLHSQNNLILT